MKFTRLYRAIVLFFFFLSLSGPTFARFITDGFLNPDSVSVASATLYPDNYYATATGTGAVLKTQLYNIIKGHTVLSYDDLLTAHMSTDAKPNNIVWDMYSDVPNGTPPYQFIFITDKCGNYSSEGDCYNREHSWPASWFGDASPMYTDLFQVVPTDGYVNGMRGNYIFGDVASASWTSLNGSKRGSCATPGYTGTVFEPIDEYKGDFARNYFYMVTRYENLVVSWSGNSIVEDILDGTTWPAFESWYLTMLGQWHTDDPVSPKEIARNDSVYALQGNRNPYIDHPEWVYSVWGVGTPSSQEPSAYPSNFSAHNIYLQWADATGGLLPEAYLIRMSTASFEDIPDPTDGTEYPDSPDTKNVAYGVQGAWFKNLQPTTSYYFKLYGYRGSGSGRKYKTGGDVPKVMQLTGQ